MGLQLERFKIFKFWFRRRGKGRGKGRGEERREMQQVLLPNCQGVAAMELLPL